MSKDWTGNRTPVFSTLGASSHSDKDRQVEDYYATDPEAAHHLLKLETFSNKIWECACGEGHLSKVFVGKGFNVRSSDLINRGYGDVYDFLGIENQEWNGDIITNPPYKNAQEFIEKSLSIIKDGSKVAMFLKVQFLEGKGRKHLFLSNPPKAVYISCSRINCAHGGQFEKYTSSAIAFAWFVWQKGFKRDPVLKWFN